MTTHKITATQVQQNETSKNIFAGLYASGLLAKWPIIGALMFIFGSLMFGGLTYNLFSQGPLLSVDKSIATTLPAIALKSPPYVKFIMEAGYYIGNEVIIVLSFLVAFYFLSKRSWPELTMLILGLAGSSALFLSLSNIIGRARPPTQIWLVLNIPGFPSGHTSAVIVFYGLMAYLSVPNIRPIFWKAIAIVVAIFIMGFVGFSRIFTGGHYLTDILAGYSMGIAWSGLIYTLIETYFQKRRSLHVQKG